MADQFLLDQITQIESQITTLNATLLRLDAEDVVNYSLNDGQTTMSATRRDVDKLNKMLNRLLNSRKQLRINCGIDQPDVILIPDR